MSLIVNNFFSLGPNRIHVQPKAAKGKAPTEKKVPHPYSRKAAYMARAAIKQDKKER